MPNWVQNKLVISGPAEDLTRLAVQLSQPYETEYTDFRTDEVKTDTVTGDFLLWNIVKPENLDAYYQRLEREMRKLDKAKATNQDPTSVSDVITKTIEKLHDNPLSDFAERFAFEVAHGDDWWHWNVRNWGTKWEIDQDRVHVERANNSLVYEFPTAWSPPAAALDNLAKQYPSIAMTLRCHDEGDMFAAELHWANAECTYDEEIEINHYLFEELYGQCHACDSDYSFEERLEAMEHYKCPKEA